MGLGGIEGSACNARHLIYYQLIIEIALLGFQKIWWSIQCETPTLTQLEIAFQNSET